jgi:hypothetical protein
MKRSIKASVEAARFDYNTGGSFTMDQESFFGAAADKLPDFEGLLKVVVQAAPNGDKAFDTDRGRPQEIADLAEAVRNIVCPGNDHEGLLDRWEPLLCELAIIQDKKRAPTAPYFASILWDAVSGGQEALEAYRKAMNAPRQITGVPLVPNLALYKKGVLLTYPIGEQRAASAGVDGPAARNVFRVCRFDYTTVNDEQDPKRQNEILLEAFHRNLPEPLQALFAGAYLITIPFVRPRYQPAGLSTATLDGGKGSPGGVLFLLARPMPGAGTSPKKAAIEIATRLSLLLHRAVAAYAVGALEAKERLVALFEFVGHELKNSLGEIGFSGDDKELHTSTQRLTRLWLPFGLGAAMRTLGPCLQDQEPTRLREDWLDKTDGFTFDAETIEDYRQSVRYLLRVLAIAYATQPISVAEGSPMSDAVPVQLEGLEELTPRLLNFAPLKKDRERSYQATLTLAAIIAEPFRNAIRYLDSQETSRDVQRVLYWTLDMEGNASELVLRIWNEVRYTDGKNMWSTGVQVVSTLASWLQVADIEQVKQEQWISHNGRWFWPVVLRLHPQRLGIRPAVEDGRAESF